MGDWVLATVDYARRLYSDWRGLRDDTYAAAAYTPRRRWRRR